MAKASTTLIITPDVNSDAGEAANKVRDLIEIANQATADMEAGKKALVDLVEFVWLQRFEEGSPFTTAKVSTSTLNQDDEGEVVSVEDGGNVQVQFKIVSKVFEKADPALIRIQQALGPYFGKLFEDVREPVAVTDTAALLTALAATKPADIKIGSTFGFPIPDGVDLPGVLYVDKVRGRSGFLELVGELPAEAKEEGKGAILEYIRVAMQKAVKLSGAVKVAAP